MSKALPTFLGIGANKGGTTWLYRKMLLHPEIWIPPLKELHYFSRSRNYPSPNHLSTSNVFKRFVGSEKWEQKRSIENLLTIGKKLSQLKLRDSLWYLNWTFGYYNEEWYRSLFRQGKKYPVAGEICPAYSVIDSEGIKEIKRINPEMKIILILRNPIYRAWSNIRDSKRKSATLFNLNDERQMINELDRNRIGFVLRSDYERTINTYLKHFDSKQILIAFFDAIKDQPFRLLDDIASFLDISDFNHSQYDYSKIVNASVKHDLPPLLKEYLINKYSPMISRLSQRLGSYAKVWEANLTNSSTEGIELKPTVFI